MKSHGKPTLSIQFIYVHTDPSLLQLAAKEEKKMILKGGKNSGRVNRKSSVAMLFTPLLCVCVRIIKRLIWIINLVMQGYSLGYVINLYGIIQLVMWDHCSSEKC